MNKQEVGAMLNCSVSDSLTLSTTDNKQWETTTTGTLSCWDYWRDCYYPTYILPSYPVYIQERAKDKGKQAFEIIKVLKDKKLVQISKVSQFIDLMDELIKIL